MKINGEKGFYTIIPETEKIEDITVALMIASYELASPLGLGYTRQYETKLTPEMAKKMIKGENISHDYCINRNKVNTIHMDYVFGRCCKTYIEIKDNKINVRISPVDRNPEAIMERMKGKMKVL